mgnify:CR=1 FL=1|jgi:hypothetical protein
MDEDFSTFIILVVIVAGILLGLAGKALSDSSQANAGQGAAIADPEQGEAATVKTGEASPSVSAAPADAKDCKSCGGHSQTGKNCAFCGRAL